MASSPLLKKVFKITGITLGVLILLTMGFHFWFKAHAKQMLEDLVNSKSNGKLKLKIEKVHFNYFSRKIQLENAVFYNTDTLQGITAYRFSVEKIDLRIKAFLPLLLKKQILIDSLNLLRPHIEVTRLRPVEKPDKEIKSDVSIPEEMGKVYTSIQDGLQVLHVKRFQIDQGTFTLINKIDPGQLPLKISDINFYIDNLQVNDKKLTGNEKIMFSENIVMRSNNQDILFPDGRHRLSFGHFRINIQKKLVEFDSCTIAATKSDSSSAAFKVFFDALLLTNIDFDTLYKSEVIKADSVYCLNPKFNLEVEVGKKKAGSKAPPKLESIIQQLTGDMLLKYLVVNNADFNIQTIKNGVPSSFIFSNNNFEMQGLAVNKDAKKPVTVKSFAMAIRNYENFIKDSSYSVKFDSVLFKDDKITLSNFIFNKLNNGKIENTFSMPQFNLVGLSWDDLVFENKLRADQALMFNPYIRYTAPVVRGRGQKSQNIFQSLGAVNDYMDLQQLDIIDGDLDLKLKPDLSLRLNNATLSVQSHSLLNSKKISGIKNSLKSIKFDNGVIHAGNSDIELTDINYIGQTGRFNAGSIDIDNKKKKIDISLQDVAVTKMQVDEGTGNVYADGVKWKKANVNIIPDFITKENNEPSIELKNVSGANTIINGLFKGTSVSVKLNNISFTHLEKKEASKLLLTGLDINGTSLKIKDSSQQLSISDFNIADNKSSIFRQVVYKKHNKQVDADIYIPSLSAWPHVQALIDGTVAVDQVNMEKPVISLFLTGKNANGQPEKINLPDIDISSLNLSQPKIIFKQYGKKDTLNFSWDGTKDISGFLQATNLHADSGSISIGSSKFYLAGFIFSDGKSALLKTDKGKVAAQVNKIKIITPVNQSLTWEATINRFDTKDFTLDSMGKSKASLVLNNGSLTNLNIRSSTIKNLHQLVAANSDFQLQQMSGNYSNTNTNIQWFNAGFNRINNTFSADSFSVFPVLSKDSFLAKQSFQTDYITLKSGEISLGAIDIDTYIKNKVLNIKKAAIDNLLFTDYKDKQLPFNSGIIKPLPVDMLKKIPLDFSIDTIHLTNANVDYAEFNEKSKSAGVIPVKRMTVELSNIKNYGIISTDSLNILATGYLMDTAWIRLRVKESYIDSLGGFLMTVRLKPANLVFLNPALIPLASIKIQSGMLDTLSLRAIGREYLASGEMSMYYHDLKVRLLKNGVDGKRTFLNRISTFIANSFFVRTNNKSRTGTVFFIRNRDRSSINYLIKITMNGIYSSIGVKSNKKMIRHYKKELEKRNLPPIGFD